MRYAKEHGYDAVVQLTPMHDIDLSTLLLWAQAMVNEGKQISLLACFSIKARGNWLQAYFLAYQNKHWSTTILPGMCMYDRSPH